MQLTPQNVDKLITSALYTEEEIPADGKPPENAVIVEGMVRKFGFHPERLEKTRKDVQAMLGQLPDEFREGWSFLNMCNTKDGDLWTGDHAKMEALVALAIGLGIGSYPFPREMWPILPGGVPYVVFKMEGEDGRPVDRTSDQAHP